MRYKPEHKEETRQRILESASREFRSHGFEGMGIAKLMGKLGLTHGGFYAHFEGKEDLERESLGFAFGESIEWTKSLLESSGLSGFIETYLSNGHRNQAGLGCPIPSLSSEVARSSMATREEFDAQYQAVLHLVAEYIPGASLTVKIDKAIYLYSSMAGAIAISRAVTDPALSESILRSTRTQVLEFIQKP